MPRINNTTKRALFNARRRYNNARARANAVPNSDPEAKNRALNATMAAARNYLNAVRATARAPQATIRNRMRAAISRRYNYNAVSNANVNAFLAGHMEYNDPEIDALYREHQGTHRGGSKKATRKNSRGNYRLDPENNNPHNTNRYNTNVWPISDLNVNRIKEDQAFIEKYKQIENPYVLLTRRIKIFEEAIKHATPGSQEHKELHEELANATHKHRWLDFQLSKLWPRYWLIRKNLSFANKR